MPRWSGGASLGSCVSVVLLLGLWSPTAEAWGERGHRLVNAAAVNNLPQPLQAYFRARLSYLLEHASDPDFLARESPQERAHHYTEVEAYDSFPFAEFRAQFVDRGQGPSARQRRHGDSVWQIERFTLRLSEDLRQRRWKEADRDAVFTAHYACDLTQPLHTVVNYDGQLTRQAGIHARFETTLVDALADGWVLKPQPPVNEQDLRARIFREYVESYNQRQLIFAADRIALDGSTYLDPQVLRAFIRIDGPLARKRLEAGSAFVSSLWYTAWVRAGKPEIRKLSSQYFGSGGAYIAYFGHRGDCAPPKNRTHGTGRHVLRHPDVCVQLFRGHCSSVLSHVTRHGRLAGRDS